MQVMEFEIWRKRHAVLLREAEEERLARRLRKNGRRRGTCGFSKRVRAWVGLVFASRRPAGEGTTGIEVRWPMPEDEEKISELLELNGAPRAMAVGEGFIVAQKGGEVLAAMRYRTESKRLLLGMLVADPWTEERPLDRGDVLRRSRAGPGNGRQQGQGSLRGTHGSPGRIAPRETADRLGL